MMRIVRLVATASREANFLAAGATLALLLKILLLNRLPLLFSGAYELGLIAEAILASVVASYVFYFFVVHIKEQADREIVRPYLARHSMRVVGDCASQLRELANVSRVTLDLRSLSETDVSSAFSAIPPYSHAPMLLSPDPSDHANWFDYFIEHERRTRESIRRLLDQLPFLDASLVGVLVAIDDCSHFHNMRVLANLRVQNPDLSSWAESFHGYCLLCRQLEDHLAQLGLASIAA